MKRLDFLKRGATVASGAVIGVIGLSGASSALTSCSTGSDKKVVGLQLYSLRDAMGTDVPGTLKKVAEMGYKTLETAGYNEGKLYGYDPKEFRKMAEDLGMKVTGAHLGRNWEPENEVEIWAWWETAMKTQQEVGCKYAVMPWFPIGDDIQSVQTYCDYFNKVGEIANKYGIKFGFHNHAGEFEQRDGQVILDYLIANTDPNKVFIELDVYWANVGGVDPAGYIRKHKGRMPVLHIKDDSILGESGDLDFESIFNAAYESGMKDYFVEVERYTLPAENCVQRSFDFLEVSPFVK